MKKILILAFLLITTDVYASNFEEIENFQENALQKNEEIIMYWSSGYFGKEEIRPVGGNEENCNSFVKCLHNFLENPAFSVTLITSKKDWDCFQRYLPQKEMFKELSLNPLFIENMIEILIDGKTTNIENFYASNAIKNFSKSLESNEYKEISEKFYEKNNQSTSFLQEKFEEVGTIPHNNLLYPNFKELNQSQFLNHYIAFWIGQGLHGNPVMTSDFLRYFYGLTCATDKKYTYVDIDTFLAIEKTEDSFSSYFDKHVEHIEKLNSPSCYFRYNGEIDFIVKRKNITKEDFLENTKILFFDESLGTKIIIPYFLSATSWFFENCQENFFEKRIGSTIELLIFSLQQEYNNTSNNIVNLICNEVIKDSNLETTKIEEIGMMAFQKFSFFNAIGNFTQISSCEFFPSELIPNRKSEWSFSYKFGNHNEGFSEKIWKIFTENVSKTESLSTHDLQILFWEFLDHDYGYMNRFKLQNTPYGKFLNSFFNPIDN